MEIIRVNGALIIRFYPVHDGFDDFKLQVAQRLGVDESEFYLTHNNGKLFNADGYIQLLKTVGRRQQTPEVYVVPRVFGGKGGFGSMLRAIGAQIEKTTNRDACRDLSGRRLRDINEEQRLKRWFSKQQEREQEKVEAKKRKLDKLKKIAEGPPLPKIDDQEYNKQRAEMADSVYDAVDKGFEEVVKASSSAAASATVTSSNSSPCSDESSTDSIKESGLELPTSTEAGPSSSTLSAKETPSKKKVFKKMFDEDLESCTSSDESEDETAPKKAKVGN